MSAPSKVTRRTQAGTTEAAWVRWLLIGLALVFMFLQKYIATGIASTGGK